MRRKKRLQREKILVGYSFLAPDFIGLVVFFIIPCILAFIISFHKWNAVGPMEYIGASNYRRLWEDPYFTKTFLVTLKYTLMFVPLNFIFALALAHLVKKKIPGISLFRTIYFVPTAISLVAVSIIWRYMFQPYGLINSILEFFGISKQPWLGSRNQALYGVLIVSLYMSIGYYMVIFLAGLNDIPEQYYEAARIDGASSWHLFLHVTLPLLKSTTFFVLLMSTLQSFQVFDQIYVLTGGGPAYTSSTSVFYMYQNAFQYYNFGYSSSIAVILFIILFSISFVLIKVLRGGRIAQK